MKGRTVSFAQLGCDNQEGLEFAQDGAGYTVTGFTGTARVVVIPDSAWVFAPPAP